jgi:predicted ATPase
MTWNDKDYGEILWSGRYNTTTRRCTQEVVELNSETSILLSVGGQKFSATGGNLESEFEQVDIPFKYEGSILSALKLDRLHPALKTLKVGLEGLKSLELLAPHLMRKRAKTAGDVGLGGEKLSAFLSTFDKESLDGLNLRLRKFYPYLESLQIKSLRAGWKELRVKEQYISTSEFGATQLNDGLLRIIGILSQAFTGHSVVLFDEIENGVNQQLVKLLMDFLLEISAYRQVFVTTHSPLVLNYLPDDKAREGVIFLYKDRFGATHAKRFFDMKQVSWKLNALGPGEVFVDTDLTELSKNLAKDEGGDA